MIMKLKSWCVFAKRGEGCCWQGKFLRGNDQGVRRGRKEARVFVRVRGGPGRFQDPGQEQSRRELGWKLDGSR